MKLFFFLCLLSTEVLATLPIVSPCERDISRILKDWNGLDGWEKQYRNGKKDFFYASPTEIIGQWVLLSSDGKVLSKADERGRIEVTMGSDCRAGSKVYTNEPPKHFHDTDLKRFIDKEGTGVIYVWSPNMSLSVKGVSEIQKAAKTLKLPVLVLAEKGRGEKAYKKVQKLAGPALQVDSFEFNMRNVGMHYPAVLVFKDKKILPGIKYGFEKASGYESDLRRMLQSSR